LPCHFAIIAKFVFFVNGHYVCLCCDYHHVVAILVLVVHGAVVEIESVVFVVNIVPAVGVHEDAQTLYADTAEDAEHLALVIVELGRSFTAESEEVVAKESLDAGEGKMCEAGAVVEERMDALFALVKVRGPSGVGSLRLGRGWCSS
jgi:hypothetical protein